MVRVTADNFRLIAAKYYDDVAGTDADFEEDLRRFILIRRLLNTYRRTGVLKERLILNHIIILHNVFGDSAVPLMFCDMAEYLPVIAPFLSYLAILPPKVNDVECSQIAWDMRIVECLRRI